MRLRHAFRPRGCEQLEARVVLSHGMATAAARALSAAPAIVAAHAGNQASAAIRLGTLGDSYTDEYRFYPPHRTHARNWLEIVAANRPRIDFGPFTTQSRGAPRDQGFALNWARSDATTSDAVANQLPGLAAQVSSGRVRVAAVFIGANDFLSFLRRVQEGAISPASALAVLAQVESQAQANMTTIVNTLLPANPSARLLLATVPDVALLPIVQAAEAGNPQAQAIVAATSRAMAGYDATITTLAAQNPARIALVDLAGVSAALGRLPVPTIPFGGTTIDVRTPGDDFHDFFLADGIHVGTVGQGLIADLFLAALDTHLGARIPLLSPNQIVAFARLVQVRTQHGSVPGRAAP